MRLVWPYVRRRWWMVLAALAFLLVETAAELVQPTLMARIVDEGVANADVARVLACGAAMLAVALAGAVGAVVRNNLSQRVAQSVGREMRGDLFRKVLALSPENVDRLQPASVITRLTNDVAAVTVFVCSLMRIAVKMPVTLVGSVALIVYHAPGFAPLMLVVAAALAGVVALNMALSRPRFARLQASVDRLNAATREFLSSVRVVKAFGAEKREDERLSAAARGYCDAGIAARAVPAVVSPLATLVANLLVVALLLAAGGGGASQVGHLMAAVAYAAQLVQSLGLVNVVVNEASRASVSARRIAEVVDEPPAQSWVAGGDGDLGEKALGEKPAAGQPAAVPPAAGQPTFVPPAAANPPAVAFRAATFSYAGSSRAALDGVSFEVAPGQVLGIVGPTGSGKSTLVGLVARLYDAQKGAVLLDGRDVRLVPQAELRARVAVVPQASSLFSGTVAENLRWGDPDAGDDMLVEAARVAQAHAFVEKLDGGYGARLGQGGVNLSGGQRQRLCIARALLRRPRVLLLDDCTSALDAATERAVLDGLRERLSGTTVLLVSQRIAAVRRADLVLCLEDGRVQGLGTHGELLRSCAAYRAIYESQVGAAPAGEGVRRA